MEEKVTQLIKELRERIDELERIVLTRDAHHVEREISVLITPKGKVRGLNNKVMGVLRDSVEPIGSAEITKRLFTPEYGVSYDAFLRKVVVAVSYLHKNGKRVALTHDSNGKALWSLPTYDNTVPSKAWDKPEEEELIETDAS
ncbi:MAG: hypothetical protein IPJ87_03950 [Flavobacteriales bacterium]|nr:hypothetical protein [Flavobacteriales bacterium]MBK8949702.1 hypothetical protein [Flavobacteriales bacterium]MBK9701559.1 hypothetical protein [Flavobacteriales bacterium]